MFKILSLTNHMSNICIGWFTKNFDQKQKGVCIGLHSLLNVTLKQF
jgi:hypothetical protein